MGRMRMVKPSLFTHEGLFAAESESKLPLRLAFIGLWTECDREGRFEWRPLRLKLAILPWDDINVGTCLDMLAKYGFIVRYQVDGKTYGYIPSWNKHQKPHSHEAKSSIPDPIDGQCTSNDGHCAQMSLGVGVGVEDKGEVGVENEIAAPRHAASRLATLFDRFWSAFPPGRRQGKEAARKAFANAAKKADPEVIIAAAAEYAASPVGRGQFVKGPAPWLNQGCWDDDRAAWNRSDRVNGSEESMFGVGPALFAAQEKNNDAR